MGKVIGGMTMSLDGFVNDRNGDVARLYPDLDALRDTEVLQELIRRTGSIVMGRGAYEMAEGDFTEFEFQVPIFILTHRAPEKVARGENERMTFTFVSDGIASAVRQARKAAGDRDVVVVGGPDTTQQCIKAGLVDELHVDIRPVLLGGGLRLFDKLGAEPIELEMTGVIEYLDQVQLRYRFVR